MNIMHILYNISHILAIHILHICIYIPIHYTYVYMCNIYVIISNPHKKNGQTTLRALVVFIGT